MTPDTCPYCGAQHAGFYDAVNYFTCGSSDIEQSPECARYVRTRISQLKRMASTEAISDAYSRATRNLDVRRIKIRAPIIWGRLLRFQQDRLREIDRLRGGA